MISMSNSQSASKSLSGASQLPAKTVAMSAADRQTAARLSALLFHQGGVHARFTVSNEVGESVDLSPSLLKVLETAAGMMASGAGVAVLARDDELTSQQSADILNVSRQYMVRLLERGDIPSTKVGTHRRVRAEDLAIYRQRRDEGRSAALANMADEAQASGGYDAPATPGPRRRAKIPN
jgi:excisionase family DNA binding protein